MPVLIVFSAVVALACMVALTDWRRAWLLAVIIGVLQDPARKLTAGAPVYMTFSIVAVYATILFAAQRQLQTAARDFIRRFADIWLAFAALLLFLILATLNGVVTFGLANWKAPLLSLFTYVAPLPAVLIGYLYIDKEERLYRFFKFYAIVTSIALIGSPLEYYRIEIPALGMVQQVGDYIRFLPGIELRMISGFYRAPDIMGWHAAILTAIAIGMLVKEEMKTAAWPWMFAAAWGFYNCMISGRRKAVYMVVVFVAAFVWRYFRRLKLTQLVAFLMATAVIGLVIHKMAANEQASVYTRGALATESEVTQRLEGGVLETIEQTGFMGAGLGTATQGVQYLLEGNNSTSWQEGGLGKLAIELGVPGLLAAALFGFTVIRKLLRISAIPDHVSTSQVARVTLFGIVIANIANFLASAQAYSDAVLTILTCFFLGSLFATVTLDERVPAAAPEPAPATPLVYAPHP